MKEMPLNRSFRAYFAFFGFIILLVGIFVGWSSTNESQQYSFDSPNSALANSAMTLLIGVLVALFGGALLLVGILSTMSRPRYAY